MITCLKRDGELWGYALDQRKNINEKEKVKLDITKLEKAFAPVGDERVKMIGKLKPEYAAIFPSFHEGQEVQEKSSVPHLASEKTVEKVLSLEKMKERYQSPEYIAEVTITGCRAMNLALPSGARCGSLMKNMRQRQ